MTNKPLHPLCQMARQDTRFLSCVLVGARSFIPPWEPHCGSLYQRLYFMIISFYVIVFPTWLVLYDIWWGKALIILARHWRETIKEFANRSKRKKLWINSTISSLFLHQPPLQFLYPFLLTTLSNSSTFFPPGRYPQKASKANQTSYSFYSIPSFNSQPTTCATSTALRIPVATAMTMSSCSAIQQSAQPSTVSTSVSRTILSWLNPSTTPMLCDSLTVDSKT